MINERIAAMLDLCSDVDQSNFPPTQLYNEGWMLRLVLDWFAQNPDKLPSHALNVPAGCRWYSEALLPSQFKPMSRGDNLAESYTHADGAIGHFDIGGSGKGDLILRPDATHFVITEAKMGSRLSKGVSNAPDYDQAARSVACMAEVISLSDADLTSIERLGFCAITPEYPDGHSVLEDFVSKLGIQSIEAKVRNRVGQYEDKCRVKKEKWLEDSFLPVLKCIELKLLTWESVINEIGKVDGSAAESVMDFYEQCLRFNGKF
jgi:hypothetical protein